MISIEEDERTLWHDARQAHAELEAKGLIVADEMLATYLNGVLAALMGAPLPEQVPIPSVQVMRSPERNAHTTPDGGILITTSMLAALQNEAQLAALIGHELGHFVGRHRLVQARFEKVSRSTVERMHLSRQNETYSDRFALAAMRHAGYDPREMPRMLQLMESEDASRNPFRSHPFIPARIRDVQGEIRPKEEENVRIGAETYAEAIAALLLVAAEVELKAGLLDRAEASISRHLALRPDSGRGHYVKAELARLTTPEGRWSSAARLAYERAVELAPNDPDAVRALGFLYYSDGDLARATVLFEKYLSLVPAAADRKLVERYLAGGSPTE